MSSKKTKIEMTLQKLRHRTNELRELIREQWCKMNEYELLNGQNNKYIKMRDKLEEYESELDIFARTIRIIEHHQKNGIPYGDETMISLTIQNIEVIANTAYEFNCSQCNESVFTFNKEIEKIECPKCDKYIWSKSLIKLKIAKTETD